jgi:hypothetical protein
VLGRLRVTGIDEEPHEALPDGVWHDPTDFGRDWLPTIATTKSEIHSPLFQRQGVGLQIWYSLTNRWLDSSEAAVAVDPGDQEFLSPFSGTSPICSCEPCAASRPLACNGRDDCDGIAICGLDAKRNN